MPVPVVPAIVGLHIVGPASRPDLVLAGGQVGDLIVAVRVGLSAMAHPGRVGLDPGALYRHTPGGDGSGDGCAGAQVKVPVGVAREVKAVGPLGTKIGAPGMDGHRPVAVIDGRDRDLVEAGGVGPAARTVPVVALLPYVNLQVLGRIASRHGDRAGDQDPGIEHKVDAGDCRPGSDRDQCSVLKMPDVIIVFVYQ